MPLLFAATLFLSASLLFMVQPMVGKMILPLLGGSPAVWNACMVFFQALLLLGYQYSHLVTSHYKPKRQWLIHLVVLAFPLGAMVLSVMMGARHTPIAVAESLAPSGDTSPFLAVMALMTVAIGLPFFVASTTTPLIQSWFTYTGHPMSKDPYFLNAVGNAGSLISLLGYPLFLEPYLTVSEQTWLFASGFALLAVLLAICGRAAANPLGAPPLERGVPVEKGQPKPKATAASEVVDPEPDPDLLRILKWVALAFVPSSWMLGVTFIMTTDIASVPLLWVVPLALYLVTFIVAFSRVPSWFRLVIGNLAPVMILLIVFVTLAKPYMNALTAAMELTIHIAAFFAVAMMCHYELAHDRPKNVSFLTKYFLMMSLGGVLGGLFNALIAPLIFDTALEYYVTIVLGCLLVPVLYMSTAAQTPELAAFKKKLGRILDVALPVVVGGVFLLFVAALDKSEAYHKFIAKITSNVGALKNSHGTIRAITLVAIPVMSCFFFVDRPQRFALAVAILLAIHLYREQDEEVIYTERTFFGILKVEKRGQFTRLVHGTTLHGTQINEDWRFHPGDITQALGAFSPWDAVAVQGTLAKWDPRQEPLTYYHRTGPVGAMFHQLRTRKNGEDAKAHVAMVGLGTGSASCYALPGQKLTFYEIDAGVKRLVADRTDFFTYVSNADERGRGGILDFRMGDARLKLKEDADRKYALLLVDAFSSDSIPVHLLTKEAVELYLDRLTPDGVLALHISNKYIALEPVVAKITKELGLAARVWNDDERDKRPGKTASSWVAVARTEEHLGVLGRPTDEQITAFGSRNQEFIELLRKYGPDKPVAEALLDAYPGSDKMTLEAILEVHGPQVLSLFRRQRELALQVDGVKLGALGRDIFGEMFRPLHYDDKMPLWTDDYSDVMRVMMLDEVKWVRRKLGLPVAE